MNGELPTRMTDLHAPARTQPAAPDTAMSDAALLPLLYDAAGSHGWSDGMRAVTRALLTDLRLPLGPTLEIGCGGGQLLSQLQQLYPDRAVCGADLNPLALAYAARLVTSPARLAQAALPDLPWPAATFALLVAMDVFDQQGVDLDAALAEAHRVLAPGGALVLRVSAHPWLFGAHDIAFHTGRRYTRSELAAAIRRAGFTLTRQTYANSLLFLPVAAMRLAQRWGLLPFRSEVYSQDGLHDVAAWALRQEAAWLHRRNLPLGLSLCAVARKPGRSA